jgi:Domain of unknown function (DUF4166)
MRSVPAVGDLGGSIPDCSPAEHRGLRGVLGEAAWRRLPAAVRQRFAEPAVAVDYVGTFEVVRASGLGRIVAHLCRLLGTPVVPCTGRDVAAVVHVGPRAAGVDWNREYRWPGGKGWLVRSTKVIDAAGRLVEQLPARLCMPLEVYERDGVLHFVSTGYYFDLGPSDLTRRRSGRWCLTLPAWLSPGVTHVQHIDEAGGWFRFTMHVVHPWFGELFYQTGRFRAAEEST